MKTKPVHIGFKAPEALKARLQRYAKREHVPVSEAARRLLDGALPRPGRKSRAN